MGDVLLNCLLLTLLLLGLAHAIVFGLGRIPKGEGNHERGRGHDGESHPVQNMGREFAVEGFEGHDATLSRTAGVTQGWLAGILRGQVTVVSNRYETDGNLVVTHKNTDRKAD